ncbi:glycoside hydrolase family protein [Shewanella fodinae]|uniref:glycoside hydrolase family protein n=1 Tax=Shewanella fodinae TaxID=552357 RepID=UPI00167835D7|nr:lysozyme [Shewanella fodinae]MCL2905215.1 lysozyme [Shewanella fodinae]GGY87701.1 lysozyme [Shewanella fodinae]
MRRLAIGGISLSAAGFIALVVSEGWIDVASPPVQGDRPTAGFGSTYHIDGTPVKAGDKLTPVQALQTAQSHISKDEQRFRDSLPGVEMTQAEYDNYIDWVYQYGIGRWLDSPMRFSLINGNHAIACDALLLPQYQTVAGYDCSTPGNKRCYGVYTRNLKRHKTCLDAQEKTDD